MRMEQRSCKEWIATAGLCGQRSVDARFDLAHACNQAVVAGRLEGVWRAATESMLMDELQLCRTSVQALIRLDRYWGVSRIQGCKVFDHYHRGMRLGIKEQLLLAASTGGRRRCNCQRVIAEAEQSAVPDTQVLVRDLSNQIRTTGRVIDRFGRRRIPRAEASQLLAELDEVRVQILDKMTRSTRAILEGSVS